MKKTNHSDFQNEAYNPNDVGVKNGNLFGLNESWQSRPVVCIPVPWEVTVSYGRGTAQAPSQILDASTQLDLCDPKHPDIWQMAPGMCEPNPFILKQNRVASRQAARHIWRLEHNWPQRACDLRSIQKINDSCREMCNQVREQAKKLLSLGKIPAVVGGDHSTVLGLIEAMNETNPNFGILIFDSHLDLRKAYEGFQYSHASVFNNASKLEGVQSLTYVASRDFCDEEVATAHQLTSEGKTVSIFSDRELFEAKAKGETWHTITQRIISTLPEKVYISFDIDGFEKQACPNTGTPVSGGLSWQEALYIIHEVQKSGREIIAYDVNETGNSSDQWDASVAARLIFELGLATIRSKR